MRICLGIRGLKACHKHLIVKSVFNLFRIGAFKEQFNKFLLVIPLGADDNFWDFSNRRKS
jgi:hypothetical protein